MGCTVLEGNITETTLVCSTPKAEVTSIDSTCDVTITQSKGKETSAPVTMSSAFQYLTSLTPQVTGVTPSEGGSGGGTTITISGTFSSFTSESATVSIDGSPCIATSQTATEIVCETEPHAGSGTFEVVVEFSSGNSIADSAVKLENVPEMVI